MARTEVRKECPSCGLGVPLEAKVCEFCGWDFEEEDEWISQIEKLEQELITEKQKFDEGSPVDRMIQSTLHSSTAEKAPEPPPQAVAKKRVQPKPKAAAPVEAKEPKSLVEPVRIDISEDMADEEVAPAKETKPAVSIKVGPKKAAPAPAPEPAPMPEPEPVKAEPVKVEPPAIDLEKELEEMEREKKAALQEKKAPAEPVKPEGGKKVRRVVSSKPAAPKPTEEPAKEATKPAPAKTAAPVAPAQKPEKKGGLFGGLGKMFSMEVPAPPPSKKPAPAKPAESAKKSPPAAQPAKKAAAPVAPATKPAEPTGPKPKRMFQCPLCNQMVSEDDKKCPNCGAEFE